MRYKNHPREDRSMSYVRVMWLLTSAFRHHDKLPYDDTDELLPAVIIIIILFSISVLVCNCVALIIILFILA